MRKFEIEVEKVNGKCLRGYKPGDRFYAEGLNTPSCPFCGGAFMVIFPIQNALYTGGRFNFEQNPYRKTELACPDKGNVIFKITLLPESTNG